MLLNGINLEPYFRIKDIRGRGLIKRRINTISVPGMDGEYVESIEVPAKILEVDIRIISKNLRKTIDELNHILATDGPVPIVFPDEPDITYYGTVEDTDETGEKVHLGRHDTTIFIRRSDPYKYGEEVRKQFIDGGVVENNGTEAAKPIIELEALQPTTFAMIQNQDEEYMMIGRPIVEGEIPTKQSERVLVDELGTLVGWTPLTPGEVLPGGIGIVGGQMDTTGDNFIAKSYGTNPNGWVGPAMKKSFSQPLQNFAIDIEVTSRNLQGQAGKLMALLYDESSNLVNTLTLLDGTIGKPQNNVVFTVGNNTIMNESGENHGAYNNETVHLNLSRNGRSIVAYAYKESGGVRDGRIRRTFRDDLLQHQTPIAQIVLYIAKYKEYTVFPMSFNALVVDKLYQLADLEIPYIVDTGGIITFDHVDENILINGETILGYGELKVDKDFGASYFSLKPGENHLITYPNGAFITKTRYRPPYK